MNARIEVRNLEEAKELCAQAQWVVPPEGDEQAGGLVPFWVEREGPISLGLEAWELTPLVKATRAVWMPQEGSQESFLAVYHVAFEVLYAGTRGGGKTDSLLMDFYQHVGQGYGAEWRGVLFRRSYPELVDVINKSKKWFRQLCPKAKYNKVDHTWTFPDGEQLLLRHMSTPDDYWSYHGHCVDEGDVLTRSGWMPIQDVKIGAEVLSVDPKTKVTTWKHVTHTHDYESPGELVRYEGRGRYMSMTSKHNVVTAAGELVPYDELPKNVKLMAAGWKYDAPDMTFFDLPLTTRKPWGGTRDPNPTRLTGDQFAQFMGWWLSEGYTSAEGSTGRNVCGITQVKTPGRVCIAAMLTELGFNFRTSAKAFTWASLSWNRWLRQFGKSNTKFVPREIADASRRQLRIFFDAYVAGDGLWQEKRAYIWTVSKRMADDLAEIATKLGYAAYVTCTQKPGENLQPIYTIACNPREELGLYTDNRQRNRTLSQKTQVRRVAHTGRVYCLTVADNHTFFLRQRGSVWLSGNSYPWIAFEELCNWPDLKCYTVMMSCSRSTRPGMPRCYRATTNPYGPAHGYVKRRFALPHMFGVVRTDITDPETGAQLPPRVAINSSIFENKILLHADPQYIDKIRASARNPAELAAWVYGSWDIVAGGMFDDLYDARVHIVPRVPYHLIPKGWKLDRAFDWGSSKPFAVGWFAESNGEPFWHQGVQYGAIRGDTYMIAEWYGWNGQRNEGLRLPNRDIGEGIRDRENDWGIRDRVKPGPADSSIYDEENGGKSIAKDMLDGGAKFAPADKGPGSRKQGWQIVRKYLDAALQKPGKAREHAGFFIFDCCEQMIELFQGTPRDDKDLDDVDSDAEDHIQDMARYRLRKKLRAARQSSS